MVESGVAHLPEVRRLFAVARCLHELLLLLRREGRRGFRGAAPVLLHMVKIQLKQPLGSGLSAASGAGAVDEEEELIGGGDWWRRGAEFHCLRLTATFQRESRFFSH